MNLLKAASTVSLLTLASRVTGLVTIPLSSVHLGYSVIRAAGTQMASIFPGCVPNVKVNFFAVWAVKSAISTLVSRYTENFRVGLRPLQVHPPIPPAA